MEEPHRSDRTTARPARPHRLGVRSLLILVVLVPTLGLVAVSAGSAFRLSAQRDAAARLESDAVALATIVETRSVIADEETQSAVIAVAADLGVDVRQLSDLYGIDFEAELAGARMALDADPIIGTNPVLVVILSQLDGLRSSIDEGTATYADVGAFFQRFAGVIDSLWRGQYQAMASALENEVVAGVLLERVDTMAATFESLSWGSQRVALTVRILRSDPDDIDPALIEALLDATSRQRSAAESIVGHLGPLADAERSRQAADPAQRRFRQTLSDLASSFVVGEPSPLATDPAAFGGAFIDGAVFGTGLSAIARAAAADLRDEAVHWGAQARQDLQRQIAMASLLTAIAILSAVVLAHRVVAPIRRLEGAAHQIHEGRFALEPLATSGPRELADTAAAFNEMATTLSAVEEHAVALADDPDSAVLDERLPGRTGRALQVALNRLRVSIRGAEEHRRELEHAATHDGLTGLLNRSAALSMIDRDLARAARDGGVVMMLFVDLDGFKGINDVHGHAAGDDALQMAASALLTTTRKSDVVARLGGDEFLVSGAITEGRTEVEHLAERILGALDELHLAGTDGEPPIRCSIGMAVSHTGSSTDELIMRADSALYRAKERGRHQAAWDDEDQFA